MIAEPRITMNIPFHKPYYDQSDEEALLNSLRGGKIVGDGENTKKATEHLTALLGVRHALLTTSCTHALELAMLVLHLRPGDEVIVPSFTFVSSTNCVLRAGGKITFVDIRPDTLTLDPSDLERRITPSTRAVIPVVYAGVAPSMDDLLRIARQHGLIVVEDAAQGIGASYRGKPTGTLGDIGCYSFHETKNISTGEGGAFVTDNDEFIARAEIIREKGTNRKQFLQGLVNKYTWVAVGSSYLPPDTVGAMLLSQLEKLDRVHWARKAIHERYMQEFAPLAAHGSLTLPTIPPEVRSNYHIFYLLLRDEEQRNHAISFFRSKGIGTTFHYLPLHLSPVGKSLGFREGDFPVTESTSARLLRLPIYPALTEMEQCYVIDTMKEFLAS
jgi:dTDP-4-amino-4,6-dideoxygalactose transaminase